MRTLAEQIGNKCIHFNGVCNPSCKAGVVYDDVRSKECGKGFARYPCFREGAALPCEKRRFRTPDEVEAAVADHKASVDRLNSGLSAVRDDAAKKGFSKGNGGGSAVPCPVCKSGALHYSVSGYNGHIHGRCSTKDCLSWMQ